MKITSFTGKEFVVQNIDFALPEKLQKLFATLGLCSAPALREQPKKSAPRAKTVERLKEKEEKAKAAAEAAAAAKAEAEAQSASASEESTEA